MTAVGAEARGILVLLQGGWGAPEGRGLLGSDPRVRTIRKVLLSYSEVRHILPHKVSMDPGTDPRILEAIARFLGRQPWLVKSVEIR
ncbi:MAG: hypothetical protein ACE5JD_08695 [Candidatus Methylomirabilia bacterium]